MDFKTHIREVPDFPKPGILFYDISTLLMNADAWKAAVDEMALRVAAFKPDVLLGIESRGFLLAAPLADRLGLGFSMIRKPGKLPGDVIGYDYSLEYGDDRLEIQSDAVKPGERVVILDDLLATGGTMQAALTLSRKVGADVAAMGFLIELTFLGGRDRLDAPIETLMQYDS